MQEEYVKDRLQFDDFIIKFLDIIKMLWYDNK